MIVLTAFPARGQDAGTPCGGCGRAIDEGELIICTPLEYKHLGCAAIVDMSISQCPDCDERHGTPYDGSCML